MEGGGSDQRPASRREMFLQRAQWEIMGDLAISSASHLHTPIRCIRLAITFRDRSFQLAGPESACPCTCWIPRYMSIRRSDAGA